MTKFIILCLAGLAVCQAGLIPNHLRYHQFPNLNAVHHGHGATSYQNIEMQNYGSVPIPKELQVDDGNEHLHSQYLHEVVADDHDVKSFQDEHYSLPEVEHVVVSKEDSYGIDDDEENAELESHHYPSSNYEQYDHEAEYEYH